MVLYQINLNYGPGAKIKSQGSNMLHSFIKRDHKRIFLSATQLPHNLGIRYAASLSGPLPGLVTFLKVVLSFMLCGFLSVQSVGLHCKVVGYLPSGKKTHSGG